MLPGRTVSPCVDQGAILEISLDATRPTVMERTESRSADLAATLAARDTAAAWLRLEPTDRDAQLLRRLLQRAVAECPSPRPPEVLVIDDAYRTMRSDLHAPAMTPARLVLQSGRAASPAPFGPDLSSLSSAERDALLLAARLGYAHPELTGVALLAQDSTRWPTLLEPLCGGWVRIRPSRARARSRTDYARADPSSAPVCTN